MGTSYKVMLKIVSFIYEKWIYLQESVPLLDLFKIVYWIPFKMLYLRYIVIYPVIYESFKGKFYKGIIGNSFVKFHC